MQTGQSGAINAKVCAMKSRWNFSLRTHPMHLGPFRYRTKLGAKWAELVQLMQKCMPRSRIGTFCYKRETHHGTLNSCFSVFRNVWVHLGPFRYTKLGSKWAELVQLMQKFMPRSRVGTFRYERARSTPLDPKLMF